MKKIIKIKKYKNIFINKNTENNVNKQQFFKNLQLFMLIKVKFKKINAKKQIYNKKVHRLVYIILLM